MPVNPNLDKRAPHWMIQRFGAGTSLELCMGFKTLFTDNGHFPEGLDPEEYNLLDFGGGALDGHRPGADKECCTSLTAQSLGLMEDPHHPVARLARQIRAQDLNGRPTKDHIGSIIINANRLGYDFEVVQRWTEDTLDAIIRWEEEILPHLREVEMMGNPKVSQPWGSMRLHNVAQAMRRVMDLDDVAHWVAFGEKILRQSEKREAEALETLKSLGVREVDTPVGPKKFSTYRGEDIFVGLVGVRNSDILISHWEKEGEVCTAVIVNKRSGINLRGSLENIRRAEMAARGTEYKSEKSLNCGGTHPDVPMWHAMENGANGGIIHMFFNGTESHYGIEKTRLDDATLVQAIVSGMTSAPVPPRHYTRRRNGKPKPFHHRQSAVKA